MKLAVKALSIACLLLAPLAQAEIFICKDASGRTLTSDRPIPECNDRGMKVLGESGVRRGEIAAPLTAEQKKKLQEEEEKRKAAAVVADEQRRQDRALMARFRTEADVETARKRDLDLIKEQIKREELSMVNKEKSFKDAQKEAEFFKNKPLPPYIQQKIDDAADSIKDGKKQIAEKQAEILQINAKYDLTLKRYRELMAGQGGAPAPAAGAASAATAAK